MDKAYISYKFYENDKNGYAFLNITPTQYTGILMHDIMKKIKNKEFEKILYKFKKLFQNNELTEYKIFKLCGKIRKLVTFYLDYNLNKTEISEDSLTIWKTDPNLIFNSEINERNDNYIYINPIKNTNVQNVYFYINVHLIKKENNTNNIVIINRTINKIK